MLRGSDCAFSWKWQRLKCPSPRSIRSGSSLAAYVLRQPAAVSVDAALELGSQPRQEARDRVERPLVLARARPWDAAQQPDRVGVARVVEDLLGPSLLDHAAGVEHADAVAHAQDHVEVMADEQHARVELLAHGGDEVEHLALDGRVEAGGGLVEDQQGGILGQRHGDHHALVHPARELVWIAAHDPGRVGDLHLLEHLPRPIAGLVVAHPLQGVDLGHLVADPNRRVKSGGRVLVDHGNPAHAQLAHLGVAHGQQVLARHPDAALAHPPVTGQVAQGRERGRGLAAAGLADEPVGLALCNAKAHAAQDLPPLAADAVLDLDVLELERVVGGHGRGAHRSKAPAIPSASRLTPTTRMAMASAGKSTGHQ